MELLQQGERFRIMDPPSLPQKPEFPIRMKFCGMGLGMGIALGIVVAGAFEKLDRRIHSEEEIKKLLPYDVLVDIPAIVNAADEQKARTKMWLSSGQPLLLFSWLSSQGRRIATCAARFSMYKSFYRLQKNPFEITPIPPSCLRPKCTMRRLRRFITEFGDTKDSSCLPARLELGRLC